MLTHYIGIDPGASGGLAAVDAQGRFLSATKMPETPRDVLDALTRLTDGAVTCYAALEQVHAMPKQGVRSMFTFGVGFGILLASLTASGIPFDQVTPQKWQKALACYTKGDKNVSKQRAQQWWPEVKVTHALADALLLAEFCRRSRLASAGIIVGRAEPGVARTGLF
jgi:crossover junction endodeoxyribonuclease RuvC